MYFYKKIVTETEIEISVKIIEQVVLHIRMIRSARSVSRENLDQDCRPQVKIHAAECDK